MWFYALLPIFLTLANAQTILPGDCPEVSVIDDFEASKYLGKWYEAERYPAKFESGKCNAALYELNPNGTIKVTNSQIDDDNKHSSIVGEAKFVNTPKEAKLSVVFTSFPAPYWVLATDYDNYAVVWSCSKFTTMSARFLWILTREREPSQEILEKAYGVLEKNKLTKQYLSKTSQKECN